MHNNSTEYTPLITDNFKTHHNDAPLSCYNCNIKLKEKGYWYCKVCTKEYCSIYCFEMANFKLNHISCVKKYFSPI